MVNGHSNNRRFTIETPLGPDVLLVQSFTGSEGLSQPFRFEVELLSEDPVIPFKRILGRRVTLSIALADGSTRYVNGMVSRFAQGGRDMQVTSYQAEIMPWLWFLTLRQDCRTFQDMTVPDILTSVFDELGFFDYKSALRGDFAKQEYCVQYQETDFNFVSRLMEQHGIFYFFEHERGKHTLVLADAADVHHACPGQTQAQYARVMGELKHEDMITSWHVAEELRPGKYAIMDYHFETPHANLAVQDKSRVSEDAYDVFERLIYPGGHRDKAQGERLVQLRREEEEATHRTIRGESTCRAFAAGYRFDLTHHYCDDMNTAYVLTEVHHEASTVTGYRSTSGWGGGTYSNSFTCIPLKVPYRPPRRTPTPRVRGLQTAFVVGPEGEEMYVDKYARVKVQFHWDRKGQGNERSSCWIRVAQLWAGTHWGALFLPRIGQEVIVDFLDGDPDRPIIIGRVYNADAMPPLELPKDQEWMGFISNRLGGGDCHALLMYDHKSAGKVVMQSYGDMHARTKRNKHEWTGKDYDEIIMGTYLKEVGQNAYVKAGNEIVIEAGTILTIKAAGGFIKIDPSGITIQGITVLINSGGSPGVILGAPREAEQIQPGQVDRAARRN
jgi:type VI secretion system secreted protein VgrG